MLSWYDEQPEHLRELIESLAPLVDGVVAVDGPYSLYPGDGMSSVFEYNAIVSACVDNNLDVYFGGPDRWHGGEVEKRAYMFKRALEVASPEDWFMVVDGDELLDPYGDIPSAREQLAATDLDVAQITFAELAYGSDTHTVHTNPFRCLFRALPGLTVKWMHWGYVVPREDGSYRCMWFPIDGVGDAEPALDLRGELCLLHRPHVRSGDRVRARQGYYAAREQAGAERLPVPPAIARD